MIIEARKNGIVLKDVACLSLPLTLDCGEAFRWEEQTDGSWSGVAYGKYLNIKEENGIFILKDTSLADFQAVWRRYFDLDRDYEAIRRSVDPEDAFLTSAIRCGYGIRILRQDLWEMIVSFLISQQNNIPRIRRCIANICERYGERRQGSG